MDISWTIFRSPLIEREIEKENAILNDMKLEGYNGLSTGIIKTCRKAITPILTLLGKYIIINNHSLLELFPNIETVKYKATFQKL